MKLKWKQKHKEKLVEIISEFVDIEDKEISPETNLITDLEVDSIDFLDITSEIDDVFDIELPVDKWAAGEGFEGKSIIDFTTVRLISEFIDDLSKDT